MSSKIVTIMLILISLALVQTSFLSRFDLIGGSWLRYFNSVLLFVLIFSLFERRKEKTSFSAAIFGGFALDLYSENFFGFWIIVLLAIALLTKLVIRKYVRVPTYW